MLHPAHERREHDREEAGDGDPRDDPHGRGDELDQHHRGQHHSDGGDDGSPWHL
jgi:hypothetical protein